MKNIDELKDLTPEEKPEEISADDAETPQTTESDITDSTPDSEESSESEKAPSVKKKGPFIQIPVLISLAIVLLSAIGYFVYSAYFLHLPQEIIWKEEKDGITHYYEFSDDNIFTDTWAMYEMTLSYEELNEGGKDVIRIYFPDGVKDYEWSMTGSRLKKNQTLTLSDTDGNPYIHCEQVEAKTSEIDLPSEVQLDSQLTGEWECYFDNGQHDRLIFHPDGLMQEVIDSKIYDGRIYQLTFNLTYTTSNGYVFFTYAPEVDDDATGEKKIEYINDNTAYQIEKGYLIIFRNVYSRVASPATPDEA